MFLPSVHRVKDSNLVRCRSGQRLINLVYFEQLLDSQALDPEPLHGTAGLKLFAVAAYGIGTLMEYS